MIIIVFVYSARALVLHAAVAAAVAAVAAVAVAVAAVTGALLPLVVARVFTTTHTTIADITTIGLVAIALRHRHAPRVVYVRVVCACRDLQECVCFVSRAVLAEMMKVLRDVCMRARAYAYMRAHTNPQPLYVRARVLNSLAHT